MSNSTGNSTSNDFEDKGWTDGGVFSVLIFNLIVFAVVTLVFSWLQSVAENWPTYSPRADKDNGASVMALPAPEPVSAPQRGVGWFGWVGATFAVKEEDILARSGLVPVLYLRFLRAMLLLLLPTAIMCGAILIPLNDSGSFNLRNAQEVGIVYFSGFANWSVTNMDADDNKLWAHLVVFLVVTGLAYWTLIDLQRGFHALRNSFKERSREKETVWAHTVLVRNLPKELQESKALAQHVESTMYPEGVLHVELVLATSTLDKLVAKRAALLAKRHKTMNGWEGAKKKRIKKNKPGEEPRPASKKFCCCGPESDTLNTIDKEMGELNVKIAAEREKILSTYPVTGDAFVTMRYPTLAKQLTQNLALQYRPIRIAGKAVNGKETKNRKGSEQTALLQKGAEEQARGDYTHGEFLPATNWFTDMAPHYKDLIWSNFDMDPRVRTMRGYLFGLFTAVLVIFWTIPVIFLGSLQKLQTIPVIGPAFDAVTDLPPGVVGFISAYLPTIVAVVFNILLPGILNSFLVGQGYVVLSDVQARLMQNYYIFMFFSTLFLPAVAIGSFSVLNELIDKIAAEPFPQIMNLVSLITSPTSGYFVAFVIQMGIMSSGLALLNIGGLIVRRIMRALATTDKDFKDADKIGEFNYHLSWSMVLLVLTITMMFTVTMPITPPFGLCFFAFMYMQARYNICFVYPAPARVARHGLIFGRVLNLTCWIIALFQISTCCTFAGKRAPAQFAISLVVFLYTVLYFQPWLARTLALIFQEDLWISPLAADESRDPNRPPVIKAEAGQLYRSPSLSDDEAVLQHQQSLSAVVGAADTRNATTGVVSAVPSRSGLAAHDEEDEKSALTDVPSSTSGSGAGGEHHRVQINSTPAEDDDDVEHA